MKKIILLLLFPLLVNIYSQSYHTVTFSGDPASDFNTAEKYTSGPVDYYATFDATTLYLGAKNNTGGNFGSSDVLTIYIDTDPNATPTSGTGTTAGNLYNSVTPTLPFTANFTIKVEQFYNESRAYSSGWGSTTGFETVSTAANAREVKISFANLGSPTQLYIIMWMGYSGGYFSPAPTSNPSGPSSTPTFTNYFGVIPLTPAVIPLAIEDTPFPVTLTSFTAFSKKSGIELSWSTATEVDNYGFEIERAFIEPVEMNDASTSLSTSASTSSASKWSKIGFVEGHGNSNSPKDYSFIDSKAPNGNLQYRLKQIDFDGSVSYSDVVSVNNSLAKSFKLFAPYPNPFNPSTTIKYSIPYASNVSLKIYDVIGNEVANLVNEKKDAGEYEVEFNAKNLPSGIYFSSLRSNGNVQTQKLILLK